MDSEGIKEMMRTNLLNELGVDLFADPAGGAEEEDPRVAFMQEQEKKNKKTPVETDDSEDDDEDETDEDDDSEDNDTDDDNEDEDETEEEVVSKEEYDKVDGNLIKARKETRHLKQLLKAVGIDPKNTIAEAKAALDKGEDTYQGPSEREVKNFNRAVRGELKAAGFEERIAKLLINQFDIDEADDDDYLSDRIEEIKEDYAEFLKAKEPVKKRKPRSDLGQRHNSPKEPELDSWQIRAKNAGLPYR